MDMKIREKNIPVNLAALKAFQISELNQGLYDIFEWAKEKKLPIVIHVREAFEETLEIVDQLNDENLTGVFHCLTNLFSRRDKLSPPGICIYCDVVCSTFGMFLLYHTFCLK